MTQESKETVLAINPPTADDVRELDRSLLAGIAWTAVARWIAQVVSWAATLYVARILTPADYGLVAMASIPIGLARLIEDFGLDAIIVQDRMLSHQQLARLAGFALLFGGLLTALFIALSEPISLYFHESAVAVIICALSLMFLTDSLQILPRALLQRDLQFRTLAWLHALQVAVTAMVVVGCALLGLGYWSLVLNTLISHAVITIVVCILRPYQLAWPREFNKLAHTLLAGWRLIVSRASWYGWSNLDSTFIGRVLGKDSLGVFGFAMTFASLPLTEVGALVSKVVPGVFSAVQFSQPILRRYFLILTEVMSFLTLPMSFGLVLTADDFVLLALGQKWEAVILPLRILCLYMVVNSSQLFISHVLLWTGHFRTTMWLNILALLVLPICFYVGLQYGIAGVAWGWVIGFPLSVLPGIVVVIRILNMSLSAYSDALRPALTACLAMSVVVLIARQVFPEGWSYATRLAVQFVAGAFTYVCVIMVVFRSRVITIYQVIRNAR